MSAIRIKGGEKNINSGKRWTKTELKFVLELYVSNPDLKIHESNCILQEFANRLNRTTRSLEAQLLMFRNLDKFGLYGYKNMNSLCRTLWKEHIDNIIQNNL